MRRRTLAECTVVSILLASPALAPAQRPRGYPIAAQPSGQDIWQDMLWWYLERLHDFLRCGQGLAGSSEARMQAVSECYYGGGIPAGADADEGRRIIEELNHLVSNDGGMLDPVARSRFLVDLKVMYTALGGDPGRLD